MQNKIHNTLAGGIAGQIHDELPINPITRIAADENCVAGKFVFEGDDGETKAVGIKPEAVQNEILGVVKRAPFITGVGNSQKYPINSNLTIVNSGNVDVEIKDEDVEINKDVFVNAATGEITVNPTNSANTKQKNDEPTFEITEFNLAKAMLWYSIAYNGTIYVAVGIEITSTPGNVVAYSEDGTNFQYGAILDSSWLSVTYGNGLFVAVSQDGKTAYSEDGKTFTEGNIPVGKWLSVTYGDGKIFDVAQYRRTGN